MGKKVSKNHARFRFPTCESVWQKLLHVLKHKVVQLLRAHACVGVCEEQEKWLLVV
jgi:S-ribosylhomocysteine lyase LuxS involved in autoinducer biosynthesis